MSDKIVQKIVIPKEVLDPGQIAVIEIPQTLYEAPVVIVVPKNRTSKCPISRKLSYTTIPADSAVESNSSLEGTVTRYGAITLTNANRTHYKTAIKARKKAMPVSKIPRKTILKESKSKQSFSEEVLLTVPGDRALGER